MTDKRPPSEKERFTTTLDRDLLQQIKIMAIYERCSTNVLIEEAIGDLLKKYEDKKAKEETQRQTDQKLLFNND
jgi:metal-responsive CopG/Arc/MetJ family transcriptional regulator